MVQEKQVLFWWKDILRLNTLYRGVAKYVLGNGTTVLFWEDLWSPYVLADSFPRFFSFATNSQVSVKDVMLAPDLDSLFSLPLSQEAFLELQQLQLYLEEIPYNADNRNQCTFIWGNPIYTSSKFYKCVFSGFHAEQTFTWLWQTKCTLCLKFFAWLLIVDRLNTKDILRRRRLHTQSGFTCVIWCNVGSEQNKIIYFLTAQWLDSVGTKFRSIVI